MIFILIQFYYFIDKKRFNSSIDFKNPVAVSSHKKKKVIDQLKHDRRFLTKRRNVLSEAEKQLEAALLALQYHNAQRDLSGIFFGSSEFRENPYQAKESGSFNDNAYQRKRQLNPQRMKRQEYMSKAQQLEIIGRIISQNSPELQQRFPYGNRKDNGKHFFKQQKPPILPYQYLQHQGIPQSNQRLDFKNNFQTRPKTMLNIDRSHPDDQISMLIAECLRNTQCSSHAKCITQPGKQGFCRCLPNYRGNGISCWELSLESVP